MILRRGQINDLAGTSMEVKLPYAFYIFTVYHNVDSNNSDNSVRLAFREILQRVMLLCSVKIQVIVLLY